MYIYRRDREKELKGEWKSSNLEQGGGNKKVKESTDAHTCHPSL